MSIALVILAMIPFVFIMVKVSVKFTKLNYRYYGDENTLIFNAREEKVMRIVVIVQYVLAFIFFVVFQYENGYSLWVSIYYAIQSCVIFTVVPPFGVVTIGLVILVLKNRKRKRRLAAALAEEERSNTSAEEAQT